MSDKTDEANEAQADAHKAAADAYMAAIGANAMVAVTPYPDGTIKLQAVGNAYLADQQFTVLERVMKFVRGILGPGIALRERIQPGHGQRLNERDAGHG